MSQDQEKSIREPILRFARRARARLALVRGVHWGTRALFYALAVALVAVLVHRLFAVFVPLPEMSAGLGLAVLTAGLAAAFWPRLSLVEAAAAVDTQAGWKERLSSALALATVSHPMEHGLVEDVRARLGSTRPSRLFAFTAPRELPYSPLLALAIAAAFLFVPALDLFGMDAARADEKKQKQEIEQAVQKLEQRKKELGEQEIVSEKTKDAMKRIDDLMRELQKTPAPDKKDLLAEVSKLTDELKKLKDEHSRAGAMAEKMQKALAKDSGETGELGKKIKEGKFAEAAQELAKLRNKLEEGKLSQEEREKLQKQMEKLREKLAKDKDLSEMEKQLAKAMQGVEMGKEQMLDDLQQALQGMDGELQENESLAEALKDLERLADSLSKQHECPN